MKRSFVIGDIHGCVCTFRQLLFGLIKLRKSDTIYLLGDYIDRGPDSKGVICTVIELQNGGYDVKPILGNHEDLLLKSLISDSPECYGDWIENGGKATLKSYGVSHPADIPTEHIKFMEKLPSCRLTRMHVFVHAGLDFRHDNPLGATSLEFRLWEREVVVDSVKIGGRKLVTGHTIQDLDAIRQSLGGYHLRLDNGCYYGRDFPGKGNLLALELTSGELYVQNNID